VVDVGLAKSWGIGVNLSGFLEAGVVNSNLILELELGALGIKTGDQDVVLGFAAPELLGELVVDLLGASWDFRSWVRVGNILGEKA
jgi:hypothetical protein